jgi:hypothetical protein
MSGVLRVLFVEPPADIVNKPKNTVATVKNIAAMMTTTKRSIVRLPEQFCQRRLQYYHALFQAPQAANGHAAAHTTSAVMHIFQRNSACATLNTAVALRNKS